MPNIRERVIHEVEIFILVMNNVYDRAESRTIIAYSYDYSTLVNFVKANECEPYHDDSGYYRCYKDALYNFNKLNSLELNAYSAFGHGIFSLWINVDEDLSKTALRDAIQV